jgi:branched-chain amino acid aminotransferase
MQIPTEYSGFFFHKQLLDLGHQCGTGDNARVRITVVRQGGGLYEPLRDEPEYFIEVKALEKGFELNKASCELGVFNDVQKSYSTISAFKTLNALPYVLAAIFKRKNELGEAVLLNASGNISDAVSSNLFWIKKGLIGTPPVSEGGVAGSCRKIFFNCYEMQVLPLKNKLFLLLISSNAMRFF